MNGTTSGSCPMMSFGIGGVKLSGSASRELNVYLALTKEQCNIKRNNRMNIS
jgi:hypothetical protein